MIPDLGKYAFAVLSSYGVTIVLLVVIVLASLRRARKVRVALDEIENRRGD
ncbi:heme exporter protein CcmD [Marivita geojedonensis]|mgnify:CR=1 FL=1|uniref:heme exporter protein CcmD n=1 Tax=Marivita geojedonensis TaxID=1123756 RepID=UPI000A1E3934|nr:heme exporter protein CcmD [Marivita geojedonensis]PRY75151.1 heme exporter protein D [Marivita geojedonensis]